MKTSIVFHKSVTVVAQLTYFFQFAKVYWLWSCRQPISIETITIHLALMFCMRSTYVKGSSLMPRSCLLQPQPISLTVTFTHLSVARLVRRYYKDGFRWFIPFTFCMSSSLLASSSSLHTPKSKSKPMAFALSLLGSSMHAMLNGHPEFFEAIIEESGMTDLERDDSLVSFLIEKTGKHEFSVISIIAETYHVAALTQLPDDKETAILWWSYAAHICYAGDYKLKDLRNAINKAIVATQQRDDEIWGPSVWRGSSHQKLSLLVARYFEERSGKFVLPRVQRRSRPDGSLAIFCGDHLICPNFDRAIRLDSERQCNKYGDYFDTAEVEQEYGAEAEIEQEQGGDESQT